MRLRIYIAGPLSKGDRQVNVDNAVAVMARLIEAGHAPFCPHLSYYMPGAFVFPHETWLAVDLPWVAVADAVLRLPGPSVGADMEEDEAMRLGIPIYHDLDALLAYPPAIGDARFHELLRQMGRLHARKGADYGQDADQFANVRASAEWGVPAWVGAMIRATDKMKRLQRFAQRGSLANESAADSLMDLSVYALIALILLREEAES